MPIPLLPQKEIRALRLIESHPWTYAKTMPQFPHWYALRKQWAQEDFDWFVLLIREYGYDAQHGKRLYRYLDIGDWKYWTMGSPLNETILINRARLCLNST